MTDGVQVIWNAPNKVSPTTTLPACPRVGEYVQIPGGAIHLRGPVGDVD